MSVHVWIYEGRIEGIGPTAIEAERQGLEYAKRNGDMIYKAIDGPEAELPAGVMDQIRAAGRTIEFKVVASTPKEIFDADVALLTFLGAGALPTAPIEAPDEIPLEAGAADGTAPVPDPTPTEGAA